MEDKIEVELDEIDIQLIIDSYEKDVEHIKELEKENKNLKEQVDYLRSIERKEISITELEIELVNYESIIRHILKFTNHLHNDCKYRLNDGHIRKIRNICRKIIDKGEIK